MKIDQTIIKFMLNEAAVGVYAAAVKLSEIWYFIPNVICASLLPAIINAKKINDSSYIRRLRGLYILMIGIAMVISISATFFSHEIILLLFGSSYVGAVPSFQVYIWSTLPVFLMVPLMQYLIIENYSKIYFMATITGAFANIVLNIYLIPKYNILGSAYSTLISYFVPFVVFLFHFESRAHLFKIISNKYVKVNSSL
jgi:O-antigen/teichoic acid export membrane protein